MPNQACGLGWYRKLTEHSYVQSGCGYLCNRRVEHCDKRQHDSQRTGDLFFISLQKFGNGQPSISKCVWFWFQTKFSGRNHHLLSLCFILIFSVRFVLFLKLSFCFIKVYCATILFFSLSSFCFCDLGHFFFSLITRFRQFFFFFLFPFYNAFSLKSNLSIWASFLRKEVSIRATFTLISWCSVPVSIHSGLSLSPLCFYHISTFPSSVCFFLLFIPNTTGPFLQFFSCLLSLSALCKDGRFLLKIGSKTVHLVTGGEQSPQPIRSFPLSCFHIFCRHAIHSVIARLKR